MKYLKHIINPGLKVEIDGFVCGSKGKDDKGIFFFLWGKKNNCSVYHF